MSGPKSSRYVLTPEQQALVEQHRTLAVRQQAALLRLEAELSAVAQFDKQTAAAFIENMRTAKTLCGADSTEFDALMLQYREGQAACERLSVLSEVCAPEGGQPSPLATGRLRARIAQITERTQRLTGALAEIEQLRSTIRALNIQLTEANAENQRMIQAHMQDFAAKADTDFTAVTRASVVQLRKERQRLAEQLTALAETALPQELQSQIQRAQEQLAKCSDAAALRNLEVLVLSPLTKQCAEYTAHAAEFSALSAEYEALTGAPPVGFSCTTAGTAALREAVAEADRAAAFAAEQAYIRQCIDTVMQQMGYAVLASRERTKRNGKTVHNLLVQFEADTALCVTQTDDGRITMEIGGLDDTDRQPDDAESMRLCAQMESFCDSYTEIERRLAMGVVTEHIQLLPPEPAYAQIINCSDYGIALPEPGHTEYTDSQPKTQRME